MTASHAGQPLPRLAWVGVAGLLLSAVVDVVAHLGHAGHGADEAGYSAFELVSHVGLVASMALILVAVLVDGTRRRTLERRPQYTERSSSNAVR